MYKSGTKEFRDEVFKTLSSHSDVSEEWATSIGRLSKAELIDVLKSKRDYIGSLATHFVENLSSPSDYIQFPDIDEFAKFTELYC